MEDEKFYTFVRKLIKHDKALAESIIVGHKIICSESMLENSPKIDGQEDVDSETVDVENTENIECDDPQDIEK